MKKNIGLLLILCLAGCSTVHYQLMPKGELPKISGSWEIQDSPYFERLQRSYGHGLVYEQTKILYLLGHTRMLNMRFVRNGIEYDSEAVADHLMKKYRKQVAEIKTAGDFIEKIASRSSMTGKPYLALSDNGKAYYSEDMMTFELKRLEETMDALHAQT